jgi:conjugal transfer/entry exclusion protein
VEKCISNRGNILKRAINALTEVEERGDSIDNEINEIIEEIERIGRPTTYMLDRFRDALTRLEILKGQRSMLMYLIGRTDDLPER